MFQPFPPQTEANIYMYICPPIHTYPHPQTIPSPPIYTPLRRRHITPVALYYKPPLERSTGTEVGVGVHGDRPAPADEIECEIGGIQTQTAI